MSPQGREPNPFGLVPSPFPWLADEVFTLWNRRNPLGADLDEGEPIIVDALPTPVSQADHTRAPIMVPPAGIEPPPAGSEADHASRLASTTGAGFMGSVHWPVCCERLTTLVCDQGGGVPVAAMEAAAGALDNALTDAAAEEHPDGPQTARAEWAAKMAALRANEGGDGVAVFHCRSCGRLYGAFCEP